ncbi:NADH dehydrogenase [ubiquinone] 1 subunit C2-like [Cyanistes caeruleus]|uniref:NADH dehydrogenase [ubiquinone] 1 subunit C2-like n=1 Tax=Cyanistes caeruleus TaxID=156563 RepID=UPI000CDB8D18|nr:NADH dehydrogenase [ubiquinone] 1 subunit C2-like [Cyanistes caeruleus]
MAFLPDESRSLPPPPLLNKEFLSPPAAGVHRQVLFATVGCFVGYQLVKRAEYVHAKVDRELFEYIRHHPVDFQAKTEKKRIGELLEDFHPVR